MPEELMSRMIIYWVLVPGIFVLGVFILLEVFMLKVLVLEVLVSRVFLSAMKIIHLDAEVSAEKTMMAFVFEINSGGIYAAMILINHDTMVLLQIIMLGFEIQ